MSRILDFVSIQAEIASHDEVKAAQDCLMRFTAAFNACDVVSMDAELHFPHVMISTAEILVWDVEGKHPKDFFTTLKASGWSRTEYTSIASVFAQPGKVHFDVAYSRFREDGTSISEHRNLWIVAMKNGRWGILVRSY